MEMEADIFEKCSRLYFQVGIKDLEGQGKKAILDGV